MRLALAATFLCLVFVPFGAVSAFGTFVYVSRHEFLSAAVAFGFSVFAFGMVVFLIALASKRVAPRISFDEQGTTVRPDVKVDGPLTTATLSGFGAMAVYAVCAPLGLVDIPVPRGDVKYFVIACAAGTLVGLFSVVHIIRQRGMSSVHMTEYGIEIGTATSTRDISWDEVTAVADGGKTPGTTYVITDDGRYRTLPTDWYTPGGTALRMMVRRYWQNPEYRDELSNGRAAARLDSSEDT